MTNVDKLRETLQHIEDNPLTWSNAHYRNMGTMCFAARAAHLAGYKWRRPSEHTDPFMIDDNGREIHCRTLAVRILDLAPLAAVKLFDATNTIEELRELVQRHVDQDELDSWNKEMSVLR